MREEVTITAQLIFDCDAERSKADQTHDCKSDIGRLMASDSKTGVSLTGFTILNTSSEAETYGTEAVSNTSHQADRAEYAMQTIYTETDDAAELLRYMLCDLRHFADKNGLNFAATDTKGYKLYAEERAGKS